jgi:hypothetical protein
MATITSKVSIQVPGQQPEFIQADHPDFLSFLKGYYEFMESAELKLKTLGSVDSILYEEGDTTYITLENENRYRDSNDKILIQDTTNGAFVNGETITGQTSKATAVVRTEDINAGSRLFISSQNKFIIGEQIIGATSNASGNIDGYTANPVENIMQLMDYADVDNTIDTFFTEFKEAFMRTIPDNLTTGLDKRKLLKNIKDLYRAKGTRKGHQLFFRILLGEEAEIKYPTKDILRVSDGKWSDDQIIRITPTNSTILMEDSSDSNGDIFILLEDSAQILTENSIAGTDNLRNFIGQTITQRAVTDLSILAGGAYYTAGYSVIGEATAVVDGIFQYNIAGETVTEIIINPGSISGTFFPGHDVSGIDNADSNIILEGKLNSIVSRADLTAATFQSSQYFTTTDSVTISADTGVGSLASIETITAGTIENIIVDAAGSGYLAGEKIVCNNTNTNGTNLSGEIAVVNGGFIPEIGTLTDNFRITLESGTPGQPGELLLEESYFGYETATGVFDINETITGQASNATGKVIAIDLVTETITYMAISGSFTLGETIIGSTNSYKVTIITNTVNNFEALEDDIGMVATDRIGLENQTTIGDTYTGSAIVQESGTGIGDITDVRITSIGYGYTSLPTLTITTASGISGTIKAKGTGIGEISGINILNQGTHYTDSPSLVFNTNSNFLCTELSGQFTLNETIQGSISGATARFKSQVDTLGIIKVDQLSLTPFIPGETILALVSGRTAKLNSYKKTVIPGAIGTLVNTAGKYIGQDGFLDEVSKKIQDSYYYQDYSYVVKTGSSIVDWRDDLLASVHPAGWAVFGQVDIASLLQQLANITSVTSLGGAYKFIFTALLGMRLGTTDQVPINPTPMDEAIEPKDGTGKIYNPALKLYPGTAFTVYETITGGTSGATGKVVSEDVEDDGSRVMTYAPVSGIFQAAETITGSGSGVTATVYAVWGLRGVRDRTLHHRMHIEWEFGGEGFTYQGMPDYGALDSFKFAASEVESAASALTFRSHSVYVVKIPYSTLSATINDSVTTIGVTSATNYPAAGTIQIGSELIDYTGKAGNSFTGCTRGAHSTIAAAHTSGVRLDAVRWGMNQDGVSGFRLSDWATDYKGTALTIGDLTSYPERKNNISPPTEVTLYKT